MTGSTPNGRHPESGPCDAARDRLRAAEKALERFGDEDAAAWDDENRAAFRRAVSERDAAEMQVAELCGQEGPSGDYGVAEV